jgi:hypothetical protein
MNNSFEDRYQGCLGIKLGTTFIEPGFLIVFFFMPIKAPISIKGAEQQIHRTSSENNVEKGTAPEERSIVRNIFMRINIPKATEGYSKAVYIALISHCVPPNIL